ncbi:MAG: hypothetical protein E7516_00310 [Ruminococcaceae bacterium]|nr:hypothetical protein [Oscillospiraceae bacterium]
MMAEKEKPTKLRSVRHHIAAAVFLETSVNLLFSFLFHGFIKFFYSDYAHLTVWGDVVSIAAVVISFIIYDSFAHAAYHNRRDRLMFLGVVYVASKAASIVHYIAGILAGIFPVFTGDTAQTVLAVFLALFEIAVDVVVAVWLMSYFDKRFKKEEV